MKASEVQAYLRSLDGGWMNRKQTVDTFKAGDPDAEVTGIAVGWMSYQWCVKRAAELGCNLFITHEPTFYDHLDANEKMLALPAAKAKRKFIQQRGLVVLRCHDLWDQYPGIGIPDSWGKLLGLGKAAAGDGYYRVYDVGGRSAKDLARRVAERTAALGQGAVQLIGLEDRQVNRVVIGTGAITPLLHMVETYEADAAICSDDGFCYWRDGAWAIDAGLPVIVVNHAVSEIHGMHLLAEHLREKLSPVAVHEIEQKCMYALVGERDF